MARRVSMQWWLGSTALLVAVNIVGLVIIGGHVRTGKRVRIEAWGPEGECPATSLVQVRFDQPMHRGEEADEAKLGKLLRFEPEIPGSYEWAGSRTLVFRPHDALPPATQFRAVVSGSISSALGYELGENRELRFHTAPLRLLSARQTALDGEGRATLALEFNTPVRPEAVEDGLKIMASGRTPLAFTVPNRPPDRHVLVSASTTVADVVTVNLPAGLRGVAGTLGLAKAVVMPVRLDVGITIGSVKARDYGWGQPHMQVHCSQNIDIATARDYIRVAPEAAFTASDYYLGLRLEGEFKPSQRYEVTFLKGMKTKGGLFLRKDVSRSFTMPDRKPAMRFKTEGAYLSARGSLLLPVETVNVKELRVWVERIYENNLVHYMRDRGGYRQPQDLGRGVVDTTLALNNARNQAEITNIDLRELLGPTPRGCFMVTARLGERYRQRRRQLVLISDLGISVKKSPSDLLIWVNSLETAHPAPGVKVSVFTRTNQKVLAGVTDERGIAHFKDVDWFGDREPFAVVASAGEDTTVLKLDSGQVDRSPFDVGGRAYLRDGYEAFLYPDRGIYRPGETVHLHGIVRGSQAEGPGEFPVELTVERPDGRRFTSRTATLNKWGSVDVAVDLPSYALTGRYSVRLSLPQDIVALGRCTFQVEEFMPDRMKAEADAPPGPWQAGVAQPFTVTAAHLFGGPAAGRGVAARCTFLASTFTHPDWPGYRFEDAGREFAAVTRELGSGSLDDHGRKVFSVETPEGLKPPSALTAVLAATVSEVGGRAITTRLSRQVNVYPLYVGLRRAATKHAKVGSEERFDCALVKPDGTPVPGAELEATVYRVFWNTVCKVTNEGRYRWVSDEEQQDVAHLACKVTDGRGALTFKTQQLGRFRIQVRDKETGVSADLRFYCGGDGYSPWSMEDPDLVELVADSECYSPGETATVLLKAPFPGEALFTVEGARIHLARVIRMEGNTTEVRFPIADDYGPNVYCAATVLRKVAVEDEWSPHRACGAAPITLSHEAQRLQVSMDAPEQARPGMPLSVGLHVTDADGRGRPCELTLAAVDEGICRLTRFRTPDPLAFFYGKRRLEVTTFDLYAMLMPEVDERRAGSDSAPGGDGGRQREDPRLLNPIAVDRVKTAVLWQSRIETDEDGRAEAVLAVPEFAGALRLMAVAAGGPRFGSAERAVAVRRPLMVRCSFPRFLAPGDEFEAAVSVFNGTSESGIVALSITGSDGFAFPAGASKSLQVAQGGDASALLRVRAPRNSCAGHLEVRAAIGGEEVVERVDLPVRPPATLRSVSGSGSAPGGSTATMAIQDGWLAGTGKTWLSFCSRPELRLGKALRFLLRYPYGCLEQTTSGAFPLLYMKDVADVIDPETFQSKEVAHFVQSGIWRLAAMQTRRGGFAMWPGYSKPYPWGSCYATHFLLEARRAGYGVPDYCIDPALEYLNGLLADSSSKPVRAYACYALALAGKPNGPWMYRLHEQKGELPAYARYHLAGALALAGEARLMADLVKSQELPPVQSGRDTGGVLHSSVREAAIMLSTYMDVEPDHPHVPALVKRLEGSTAEGRWLTTQENAFALLALGKYARHAAAQDFGYTAEVSVGDKVVGTFTDKDKFALKPEDLTGEDVRIAVRGEGRLYYYWDSEGIPADAKMPQEDCGMAVRRRYLTRSGEPLDLRKLPHGEVLIVELSIEADKQARNVVVSDLLPAGLEIENPSIATRAAAATQGPKALRPDRVEMRDDRLLIFAELRADTHYSYRYVARAVTPGRFQLPPISAMCMYNPATHSVHGGGEIEVVHAN